MATATSGWKCNCTTSVTYPNATTARITVNCIWANDGHSYVLSSGIKGYVKCNGSDYELVFTASSSNKVNTSDGKSGNTADLYNTQVLGSAQFDVARTTSSQDIACYAKIVSTNSYAGSQTKTSSKATRTISAKTSYKVSYKKGDNGSGTNTEDTKWHGTALTLKDKQFTRTGYTQTAWASNAAGSTKAYNLKASYTKNEAVTLYPYWTRDVYTITYNLNGGAISGQKTEYSVISDSFTLKIPTKTGYYFSGWTGTGLSSATRSVTVSKGSTGNRTYTANWTAKKVTVNFYPNYNSLAATAKTYTYGTGGQSFSALTRTGYRHLNWNTNSGGTGTSYDPNAAVADSWINSTVGDAATKSINLYAIWSASAYAVTINPKGGVWKGSSSNTSIGGSVNGTVTIPAPTRTGYRFTGWYKSGYGSLNNSINTNPLFSGSTLPQVYNNNNNGVVTHTVNRPDNTGGWWNSITIKTSANTASPGYGGFKHPMSSASGATFIHTFRAKIPVGYVVNYHNNAVGTGSTFTWLTPNVGTGQWEDYVYELKCGTSGTFGTFGFVALGAQGSIPVTWYLTATQITKNPTADQIFTFGAGDTNMYATWLVNKYNLNYSAPSDASYVPENQVIDYGTTVEIDPEAPLIMYKNFEGWSTSSTSSEPNYYPGGTFSMPAYDVTLYAIFSEAQTVNLDTEYSVNMNFPSQIVFYKFIPEETGIYRFSSSNAAANTPLLLVMDESGASMGMATATNGKDFLTEINLAANKLYYIAFGLSGSDNSPGAFSFEINRKRTISLNYELNGGQIDSPIETETHIIYSPEIFTNFEVTSIEPYKEHHQFLGWYLEEGDLYQKTNFIKEENICLNTSAQLKAIWLNYGYTKLNKDSVYRNAIPYVYTNNEWKEAMPFVYSNNQWNHPISNNTENYLIYTVTNPDSSDNYGFKLNKNGFYESQNHSISSSYSLCELNLETINTPCKLYIDCINQGESFYNENEESYYGYDYGLLSVIGNGNSELLSRTNSGATSAVDNVKHTFFDVEPSGKIYTISYGKITPAMSGQKIEIKYIKDISFDGDGDSFQFRPRIVTSLDYEIQNITDYSSSSYYDTYNNFISLGNDTYQSTNTDNYSISVCKIVLSNVDRNYHLYIDCYNSGELKYDFGFLSNINGTLESYYNSSSSTNSRPAVTDSNVKYTFYGASTITSSQTIDYGIIGPEHSGSVIEIAYRKDSSQSSGEDLFRFQIRTEEI